jgi:hypothetical protein
VTRLKLPWLVNILPPAIHASEVFCPSSKGVLSSGQSDPGRIRLVARVQAGLENFSPGKRVPFDCRSQKAVACLVRSEWKEIMAERVPGIDLDNT